MIIQNNTTDPIFLGWLRDYDSRFTLGRSVPANFGTLELPDEFALTDELRGLQDSGDITIIDFDASPLSATIQQELNEAISGIGPGGGEGVTISLIATEDIASFSFVSQAGSNQCRIADKDSAATMPVLGIVESGVITNALATITTKGRIINVAWTFTPNMPIFMGTSGQITQTPPTSGRLQNLGAAITTNEIYVDISTLVINRG